jgi:hypothetical protein
MGINQPSASRTTNTPAPFPSSELLGHYHSSALRTEKSTFWAKPLWAMLLNRFGVKLPKFEASGFFGFLALQTLGPPGTDD